jgi:AAA family ATP:ADP antiporter
VLILTQRYSHSGRRQEAEAGASESKKDLRTVFNIIRASRYLKLIVALLALSAVTTLIIDFQFKVIVQQSFHVKDQLTHFFGSFYAYLSLFSFLLQVLAGSRIVEKFGVRVTLLVLPLALLGGTGILLAYPLRLWAGSLLKGSDQVLRYSIDKSTIELLYLPVPQSVKAEVKAVIDMVLQRLADGVGGLLLLVLTHVLKFGMYGVGFFNAGLLGVWVFVAVIARKEYVSVLRATLAQRPALPKSTLQLVFGSPQSVATLQSMLEARDEEVVLYAIELAQALGRKDWIPAKLTTHPSPRVRLKALEIVPLNEKEILARGRTENDSVVRASAIARACKVVQPGRPLSVLDQFLQDSNLRVRLSALVCLAQDVEGRETEAVAKGLNQIAADLEQSPQQAKDVAEALGEIRHPAAVDLHLRLLRHPDPAVKKQAILSAGQAEHRELVPFLIPLLADRELGSEARCALQAYGPRILGTLADIVKDPLENVEVRRNIPLVLAYIPDQTTVDILLDTLFDYDGLVRYRAIRALHKLRVIDPDLYFEHEKISLRIREECEKALAYQQALNCLYPRDDGRDLLAQLLRDKINYGRERVFRLLALMLPPTTACASFLALAEDDRLRKAAVAEYLDNVLPGKLKAWILPLVEPRPALLRTKKDAVRFLEAFLQSPDLILRDCAVDAINKRRWPECSSALRGLHPLEEQLNYG